MSHWIRSGN